MSPTSPAPLTLRADASFADVPHPDIIVVPGGPGQAKQMDGSPLRDWLIAADQTSTWTTSVCTGSLILAGAGLLDGRQATTNWMAMGELARLGATPLQERYVFDGKYATAAGVSAGIDMALALAGRIGGDELAQRLQLGIEYDPQPPHNAGLPDHRPARDRGRPPRQQQVRAGLTGAPRRASRSSGLGAAWQLRGRAGTATGSPGVADSPGVTGSLGSRGGK